MAETFNIAGYVRISVDDDPKNKNISIEHQREIIKDFVNETFPGSKLTFYEDRDKSGYTFEKRPGYQQMRPLLMNGTYDILIVKDFSRFSRRNSKGLGELEDLRDAGRRIISVGDNIDFPNDDDWIRIQLAFLVNEMPVTDTSKKVRKVVGKRQEKGEWISAAPYGYKMAVPSKDPFIVVPEEAEVVRKIFELYNKGWGYKKIANYLTDQHILTPRASQKARKDAENKPNSIKAKSAWSIATVQSILCNNAYIGTLTQGKTTRTKIGGKAVSKPATNQYVFENHHAAIIDFKTFKATQEAMTARTKNHYRGQKKYDNFYSGLMVCGDCGSPMFPMSRKANDAYRCGEYHKRGLKACTSHFVKVEMLDSVLKEYLRFIRSTSAEMIERINMSLEDEDSEVKKSETSIENLEKLIKEAEEERKIHLRQKARAIIKEPDKEEELEELYDEMVQECTDRIEGIRNQIDMISNRCNMVIHVNKVAKTALQIFDDIINKDKLNTNDLLLIIEKIIVFENHIEIELKSDIDTLLRCGTLPEPLENAANFNSGTVDIASTEIVQVSRNHSDKVYSVNVISNGDPLEIYTDSDGEVIFKKYSPIGELSSITGQYADVLARGTGLAVIITDRDSVIACAGISKKEILDRRVSRSLEGLMERRENYVCSVDNERIKPVEGVDKEAAVVFPIVGGGDVSGALVMLLNENGSCPTQTETKLAQIAANFLGKQMEE